MATFIHGIGASENIDSSGEIVSIKGLDISSLDKDGVFNYEHKSDLPAQTVGKILKAKKIFSDADCDDDYQLYFWNKCKTPYLYVMGELFDDYSDSAREVAGRFKYDADRKNQNERNVMNFSVEGSKISKEGITVTRSIARKITITILPCNKVAIAEMVSVAPAKAKGSQIDELFKTEDFEIEIFTPGPNWGLLKKEDPKKHADKLGIQPASETEMKKAASLSIVKPHQRGNKIGMTSSGKAVHSHGMVGDYHGFSAKDHIEAAGHHQAVAAKVSGSNSALGTHHGQKATLHMQASKSAARKASGMRKNVASEDMMNKGVGSALKTAGKAILNGFAQAGAAAAGQKMPEAQKPKEVKPPLKKAMEAGSAMAAPPQLSGGAALSISTVESPQKKKKSQMLMRAEADYASWAKREEFETFMKSRMPGLTKGEIQVIGQTMLLQKSLKQEKALTKVASSDFQKSSKK